MKNILYILLLILLVHGCMYSTKDILPNSDFKHLDEYHCWPYNVDVYSIGVVDIDSLFFSYPLNSYFGKNSKYEVTTWTKYKDIDNTVWSGMEEALKLCDDNLELSNQLSKGGDVYYSGIYLYFKTQNGGKVRRYEQILFLDLSGNKMHVFRDINKVY